MSRNRDRKVRQALKLLQEQGLATQQQANPNPRGGTTVLFEVRQEAFAGPLPPPSMLSDYNNMVPRGAERIMVMAEKQQDHRFALENRVIDSGITASKWGQFSAFILVLVAICGGLYVMIQGKGNEGYGLAAVISSIAGLGFVFLIGRKKEDEERAEKRAALPQALK